MLQDGSLWQYKPARETLDEKVGGENNKNEGREAQTASSRRGLRGLGSVATMCWVTASPGPHLLATAHSVEGLLGAEHPLCDPHSPSGLPWLQKGASKVLPRGSLAQHLLQPFLSI